MNHLGNFPKVLKYSQEAEETLKRTRERLLSGSKECQLRSGNINPRKTLNTYLEVNVTAQPKLYIYQGYKSYFASLFLFFINLVVLTFITNKKNIMETCLK